MANLSLQQTYAPNSICFGCGPANNRGLRIASFARDGAYVATFRPAPEHQAFPGMINGGIIGSLLDCHSNWAAADTLRIARGQNQPPCTVTAEYAIKLLHPTPAGVDLSLEARVTLDPIKTDRARVEATLSANGKICATCTGLFVAVKEGHPAFHRWS